MQVKGVLNNQIGKDNFTILSVNLVFIKVFVFRLYFTPIQALSFGFQVLH
jgi:hypothetical protein